MRKNLSSGVTPKRSQTLCLKVSKNQNMILKIYQKTFKISKNINSGRGTFNFHLQVFSAGLIREFLFKSFGSSYTLHHCIQWSEVLVCLLHQFLSEQLCLNVEKPGVVDTSRLLC